MNQVTESNTSRRQPNDNSNVCQNDDAFATLIKFCQSNPDAPYCKDVTDAKTLYDNAKFYYLAGQLTGALVSFSCTSVLLNSIIRSIGDTNDQVKNNANNLLQCCLQAVNVLQSQVGSSSKAKNDDEDTQDWAKICTKIKPLVFAKNSSDCLFFSGIAGLKKEQKLFKTSLIFPLIYPNLYPKASKGILLYGPPGTGKTYIVKAAVNELQKSDPTVGVLFFSPSPGDLKGKYVGETEKRIEEIFTCASRAACESEMGCGVGKKYQAIIFMDEFDAIGPDRSDDPTGLAANSVNTLLQMMDGIKSKQNVAVIAATNYPWKLDSAILRRFTTQILIDLPNSSDIKQLLNIEVKKMVEFKEEKKFSWCESQQQITEKETATGPSCDFECEEKIPVDLTTIPPYNSVNIDYYSDKEYVDGLVNFMASNNFSNSDVARFMLAAQTNSGELAVKGNIFYKASMLEDHTHDVYISSLTKPKNSSKGIQNAIQLLKNFDSNSVSQKEFFQVEPPDILKIEYNGYYYYNVKSLLYKDNTLIVDHPSVKDIYIKLHTTTSNIDDINEETYKENVLGKKMTNNSASVDEYGYNLGTEMLDNNVPIDIIITFDFYIKETNSKAEQQTLLPLSNDLIKKVFKPIYNSAKTIYTKVQELNNIEPGPTVPTGTTGITGAVPNDPLGNEWFKKSYSDAEPPTNDTFFNIPSSTSGTTPSSTSTSGFFTDFIGEIQEDFMPLIDKSTAKEFSFKYTNFDFYNYLLLYKIVSIYHENNPSIGDTDGGKKGGAIDTADVLSSNVLKDNFMSIYLSSLDCEDLVSLMEIDRRGNINFEPIQLLRNDISPSKTYDLLYDIDTNRCLIKISDYIKLIKNYKIYQEAFDGFKNTSKIDNNYISIDVNIFKILFRNSFDNSKMLTIFTRILGETQLFPEMDENTFNLTGQRLIQLFINDILNFNNLSEVVYKDDQTKLEGTKSYIKDMLIKLNDTDNDNYQLLQLICLRVYNNSNFVQSQSSEINGGSNNVEIPLSDIDNHSVKMGGKKKFKLTKNKANKSNKTAMKCSRKNKIKNVNKTKRLNVNENTENDDKIFINNQTGGALEYKEFIDFVISSETNKNVKIVNKNIFVATQYDYSAISESFLRKTSVANSIFYSVYDLFGDKNNKAPQQIINQLQKKNQYLPLVFKKIKSIGFFSEKSVAAAPVEAAPGTAPGTAPVTPTIGGAPAKTIDDKDIKNPEILWNDIDRGSFNTTIGAFIQPLAGTSKSNIYNVISLILEGLLAGSSLIPSNSYENIPQDGLDLLIKLIQNVTGYDANVFGLTAGGIATVTGIGLLIIYMLGTIYSFATSQNVSKETILDDFTLITIFSLITEIQQVETDDLDNNTPIQIFLQAINVAKNTISWWVSFSGSIKRESNNVSVNTKTVSGTVKKYNLKTKIDPELKKKLTNLNVPIQSFSYALTLVKTTYDKETGTQLKLYDTNREELLKQLRKKK